MSFLPACNSSGESLIVISSLLRRGFAEAGAADGQYALRPFPHCNKPRITSRGLRWYENIMEVKGDGRLGGSQEGSGRL